MKAAHALRKFPRFIYWLCGVVTILLVAGWFLFGAQSRDIANQRLSRSAKLTFSKVPDPSRAPSRLIVGEPLESRLSSQDNAATEWRKAFALADKLTARESCIAKNIPNDPPPTDDEIAAFLEKIAPIIALLREGGAKPECDWDVDLSPSSKLSHTFKASSLAQIALWDSVQRVGTAPQDAVENVLAMARLGNSLQAGSLSGSTNAFIHNFIFDFLGTYADSFRGPSREIMQAMLEAPDLAQALQASLGTEQDRNKYVVQTFFRALRTGQTPEGPVTEKDKQFIQRFVGSDPSETQLLSYLQEAGDVSKQALYWKDDKFQNWLKDYRGRFPSPGLLGEAVADDSSRSRDEHRVVLTHQQMVKAGWAAMEEGPTAISRLRDPLTGKPFGYRVLDEHGSFELQSEVLQNGKPVTMTFPRTGQ